MPEQVITGVGVGAGYFSQFHYEAWSRIPEVAITAICDLDANRAEQIRDQYGIPAYYDNFSQMLDTEKPDFVDIITPPNTHLAMCQQAAERGIAIICQKPLAPTLEESRQIVELAQTHGVSFMVHENFRWQPWYREIKQILNSGTLGEVFHLYFRMRMGDGWGADAYLSRQPFFREYPRLLVYETGIHFVDTFRYLMGNIESVYANLRRLNPVINGEDAGQIHFNFTSGSSAIWDANRYNETDASNPRYTFGELRIDAEHGHLLLNTSGSIHIKLLGKDVYQHHYQHQDVNFSGDSVYAIQRHFVDQFITDSEFETSGSDYLVNVHVMEAIYRSSQQQLVVRI